MRGVNAKNIDEILNRIEMLVAQRGYGKEAFYELSETSSASFSQWKTGAHKPSIQKLSKIAEVLNVTVEYLVSGKTEQPAAQGDGPMIPQEFKARYWALSKQSRDELDRYAQYLLARESELQDSADSQKKVSDK